MSALRSVVAVVIGACGGTAVQTPVTSPPARPAPHAPPAAPSVDASALSGPIKSVSVTTPDRALGPRAKALLEGEIGKPIDRRRLRAVLDKVYELAGVSDVSASATQLPDGVDLIVDVVPSPILHALTAHEVGGGEIVLPGSLATAAGLPIDLSLLDAVVHQFRDQYLEHGFVDAAVAWKQTPADKGQVDAVIEITPGPISTIASVDFKGNTHTKRDELAKLIVKEVATGSPWNADLIDRAVLLVTGYYFDRGYISVAVSGPKPAAGASPALFTITEGDQYRLGKLDVAGVAPADAKKYVALAGMKPKDVFSRAALIAGIQKITEAARAAGMTNATVEPVTKVDPAKKSIDLILTISK